MLQKSTELVKFLGGAKIFTKSGFFTKSTVILLHNSSKVGGTKINTKSAIFTIFTFTKSALYCIIATCIFKLIVAYICNLDSPMKFNRSEIEVNIFTYFFVTRSSYCNISV